jgi:hypothetical protein
MSESAIKTPSLPPSPPSVEEITRVLAEEDNEYTNEAERLLRRIRDLLRSGDYAILSRADREAALINAVAAGIAQGSTDHDYNGEALEALARTLLHLGAVTP